MNIDVNNKERDLLARIVDQYYSTLREEIYKTEAYQIKRDLKEEEAMVKDLLERLRSAA